MKTPEGKKGLINGYKILEKKGLDVWMNCLASEYTKLKYICKNILTNKWSLAKPRFRIDYCRLSIFSDKLSLVSIVGPVCLESFKNDFMEIIHKYGERLCDTSGIFPNL